MIQDEQLMHDRASQEYQDEKADKKQKLMRDGFKSTGYFGIPLIKRQNIDINKIELWGYTKAKEDDKENRHKTIHFFTNDWLFENVYQKPEVAMEKLNQYYALLTPEFSTYKDMPLAVQLWSTFKNRWCGAYWQKQGMKVIPTITWGTPESFNFCFDGVEQNSVVAVSTYYLENNESGFMAGYNKMLEILKPSAIICYGGPFEGMKGNVKFISPYDKEELIKKLGFAEFTRRYMEGDLYPSI